MAHNRPRNGDGRRGACHIDVAAPEREHLPDACGGAEHHLDELPQLPVWLRTEPIEARLPMPDREPHGVHLCRRECIRQSWRLAQPRYVIDRIAGDDLVAHGQAESEAKDNAGSSCPAVAALRELLEKEVAARNTDVAKRHGGECRQNEGPHGVLVGLQRADCEPCFRSKIAEPVLRKLMERALG